MTDCAMTSPKHILELNIARERALIRGEKDPQHRAEIQAVLDRDLREFERLTG